MRSVSTSSNTGPLAKTRIFGASKQRIALICSSPTAGDYTVEFGDGSGVNAVVQIPSGAGGMILTHETLGEVIEGSVHITITGAGTCVVTSVNET